jgi:hypothetical protein
VRAVSLYEPSRQAHAYIALFNELQEMQARKEPQTGALRLERQEAMP